LNGQLQRREIAAAVIVLDLNLPDIYRLDLCRSLPRQDVTLPILMLTAMTDMRDKLSALTGGADDYVTKPFAFEEVVARIQNLARRGQPDSPATGVGDLLIGRLRLSQSERDAFVDARRIGLTAREFEVLSLLATRSGQVVCKERMETTLWGGYRPTASNIVNAHISHLRRKIGKGPNLPEIRALRGRGFVLDLAPPDQLTV
jgi:DNA-binding response OmpR family regulator